jgi:hypothetical protein
MVGRTLGRAIELGANGVVVRCTACLNLKVFKSAAALKLFGAETPIKGIPARCRCRCGAKAKHAVTDWPRRARGDSEPLPIVPKEWGGCRGPPKRDPSRAAPSRATLCYGSIPALRSTSCVCFLLPPPPPHFSSHPRTRNRDQGRWAAFRSDPWRKRS